MKELHRYQILVVAFFTFCLPIRAQVEDSGSATGIYDMILSKTKELRSMESEMRNLDDFNTLYAINYDSLEAIYRDSTLFNNFTFDSASLAKSILMDSSFTKEYKEILKMCSEGSNADGVAEEALQDYFEYAGKATSLALKDSLGTRDAETLAEQYLKHF